MNEDRTRAASEKRQRQQQRVLKQRRTKEAKSRALNWHLLRTKVKIEKQDTTSSSGERIEAIGIADDNRIEAIGIAHDNRIEAIGIAHDNRIPAETRGKRTNRDTKQSCIVNRGDSAIGIARDNRKGAIGIAYDNRIPAETRSATSSYTKRTNSDTKQSSKHRNRATTPALRQSKGTSLHKSEVDIVIQRLKARKRSLDKENLEITETIRTLQLQKEHL